MTLSEIAKAVHGELHHTDGAAFIDKVSTDSREADGSTLFVALKGERFDGHDFIDAFYQNGGRAVISERETDGPAILVEDTLLALGDLARYYRGKFSLPLVGITGSVGKTSTRRMIESVLSAAGKVCGTQGNLNNDIGLPRTLLTLERAHKYAVIEMGMNHAGEIRYLTGIAKPEIAVITNAGTAHIGNLGSREAILRAKLEILEGLAPHGLALLCGDDERLYAQRFNLPCRSMYYGIHNPACDLVARDVVCGALESQFKVGGDAFTVHAPGEHHVSNALAAIAVGLAFQLPVAEIQAGVESFRPAEMRQTMADIAGVRVIEDCYNANADSMQAALSVLAASDLTGRKIAVLGDMLELGEFTDAEHRRVGDCAVRHGIALLVTVGKYAAAIAEQAMEGGVTAVCADDNAAALRAVAGLLRPGDTVLVKASRSARFEEISQGIRAFLTNRL
jgi:UDP-N-acetylmuramoyl-tripeptide--D-alanyl-D-alanine ligase